MKESKGPRVIAVHRGLQILELLAGQQKGHSTSEVSRRLKIPKSTASYLLHTLWNRGYLQREADGTYRLGMKLLALGSLALHGVEIREVALPVLRKLVAETGITGHIAVPEGTEAIYIERVPCPGFIQMDTWVGRRIPLHSSGVGKTLLAFLPEGQAEKLIESTGLPRLTSKTIVSPPRLKQELKKIRENGFAIDNEENTVGVRCVAAPIFSRTGKVLAALSLTGPVQQITDEQLPKIIEKVKEAAHQMTKALGGAGPVSSRKNT
ncbi:MAG: IclR family transcriptional regulator [Acidobacteria bacterium]|nr:IclR family transcriptional regulator [Acidobacteriota bacterium]